MGKTAISLLNNVIKHLKTWLYSMSYSVYNFWGVMTTLCVLTFPICKSLTNITRVLYMKCYQMKCPEPPLHLICYQTLAFQRFCHMLVSVSEPQASLSQFFCSQLGLASHMRQNFPFTLIIAPHCWTIKCVCARLKPLDHGV